ncbi:MAG TPA: RDD family protein [Chitinophagaceae bacterium]|nr:RDD family protein [Chitinophagaceae bacterium]
MSTVKINTPFNIDLDFELAEIYKRILAYGIDLFLLVLYSWGMRGFLYNFIQINGGEAALGIDITIVSVPMLLYPLFCELTFHGQSVGKKIIGLRVISLKGGEPDISQYIMRWIFRVFEWPLVFGFVFPGSFIFYQVLIVCFWGIIVVIIISVTQNSQRLGDLAAETVVINTKIKSSIHDTIFQSVTDKDYKVMFPEVMKLSDRDINTIKNILNNAHKKSSVQISQKISGKIQQVLQIQTQLKPFDFLEQLITDYNYLATKE